MRSRLVLGLQPIELYGSSETGRGVARGRRRRGAPGWRGFRKSADDPRAAQSPPLSPRGSPPQISGDQRRQLQVAGRVTGFKVEEKESPWAHRAHRGEQAFFPSAGVGTGAPE